MNLAHAHSIAVAPGCLRIPCSAAEKARQISDGAMDCHVWIAAVGGCLPLELQPRRRPDRIGGTAEKG